jgi:hypothetical protein
LDQARITNSSLTRVSRIGSTSLSTKSNSASFLIKKGTLKLITAGQISVIPAEVKIPT